MHETIITVRFGETDALGHVNNTSYFIYLEEARIKFFEQFGYKDSKKWNFILASTKCDFVSQAYFNQKLKVTSFVSKIGTKSFQLNHDILDNETGKLIAKGSEVIVFFDFDAQKSIPIPELLRVELERHLVVS